MRFRWKLLLLLLVIGLMPMLFMRLQAKRAIDGVTANLVAETRQTSITWAENQMRLYVESMSRLNERGRELLEMAVAYQAAQAAWLLQGPPLKRDPIFVTDIRQGRFPADSFKILDSHVRVRPSGERIPIRILPYVPAFSAATGASREEVEDDARRLTDMETAYRTQLVLISGLSLWQTVCLENGLVSVFPGNGELPGGFDPRTTEWYQWAIKGIRQWSEPFVDPITRQVVLAVSRRIMARDGRILGVASILVPLNSSLDRTDLVRETVPDTKLFLAFPERQDDGHWRLHVLAGQKYEDIRAASWRTPVQTEWLVSKDSEKYAKIFEAILDNRAGSAWMEYEGGEAFWAFGPTGYGGIMVSITPMESIVAPARHAGEVVSMTVSESLRSFQYLFPFVLVAIVFLALAFSRSVTRPIRRLGEAAGRLSQGDFSVRVKVNSRDELGDMANVFNEVAPRLEEFFRINQSLALAEELQQTLLPTAPPRVEGLDIAGRSLYSEMTGGDYFDYLFPSGDASDLVDVVVGDISGHGAPAALLMTTARALLRQRSQEPELGVAEFIRQVNKRLTPDVYASGRFMTLFFLEICPRRCNVEWVRAGHDPALVHDPVTGEFFKMAGGGLPLGVDERIRYQSRSMAVSPGQYIVVGTDGIWEARNPEGEMFGKERYQEVIRESAGGTAKEMVEAVFAALKEFSGRRRLDDDVTLVVVRVLELPGNPALDSDCRDRKLS